jgi:hypothetical protein
MASAWPTPHQYTTSELENISEDFNGTNFLSISTDLQWLWLLKTKARRISHSIFDTLKSQLNGSQQCLTSSSDLYLRSYTDADFRLTLPSYKTALWNAFNLPSDKSFRHG